MRRILIPVLLALVAFALTPGIAEARFTRIASYPVTFAVQNVDRSKLICGTDGASYEIKGYLTGPKAKLSRASSKKRSSKRAATLYLHGLGFGEWFWHPNTPIAGQAAVPLSSNYVLNQAENGHVSVTIDRLGYDTSGHPEGLKSCLGGQADIAHQVIQALRSGKYAATGTSPIRFKHIALAGHSIGGEIAMLEAYSFKDIDALAVISFSYQNLPFAQVLLGPTYDTCTKGGEPADAGLPTGYAYYGAPAPADFQSAMFHGASQAVLDGVTPLRNRDPCGDTNSIIPALLQQGANLRNIKVPVLLICGTSDRLFSPGGCNGQAVRLTKSRKVTVTSVRNAGHAITLDAGASTFRRKIGRWLEKRGF
jgi:pimeloyl-ACP methyl ester carboxylesterase